MFVRLTAKLADIVDGIDLSPYNEGDLIDLPEREARMLVAERWAEAVNNGGESVYKSQPAERAIAADRSSVAAKKGSR